MADQFFSFDEALSELRLKEEELKRLVSEGEIRAFRDGDTMKLRRMDVENLRNELSGGDVVDLGGVSEELVFEDDADLSDEAGMATEEISDVDTIIEDDVEDVGEIDLDDEEEEVVTAAPVRRTASVAAAAEDEADDAVDAPSPDSIDPASPLVDVLDELGLEFEHLVEVDERMMSLVRESRDGVGLLLPSAVTEAV